MPIHIRSNFKKFSEFAGIIYMNSLALFTGIVTKEMYIDILRLLREAVTKKDHEKWRTNI